MVTLRLFHGHLRLLRLFHGHLTVVSWSCYGCRWKGINACRWVTAYRRLLAALGSSSPQGDPFPEGEAEPHDEALQA